MRIRRRTLRRLSLFLSILVFLLLAPISAAPALSQNLLVNPGFERDLSGWTVYRDVPVVKLPAQAFGDVIPSSAGFAGEGSRSAHLFASGATVSLSQCVPVAPDVVYSFGARARVDALQGPLSALFVGVLFDSVSGCSRLFTGRAGVSESSLSGPSPTNGLWVPLAGQVLAPSWARTATVYATVVAGLSYSALVDDMFLAPSFSPSALRVLPSVAHAPGLGSSLWTTDVVLANPGSADAFATLKFLGHDVDGRSGDERTLLVPTGGLVSIPDVLATFFPGAAAYGAVRILTEPVVVVQSETSTPVAGGGTVGQALPAFGESDFAGSTPRTLAPIRENASFRTNLVLANPTEIPVSVHVALFAADGSPIGTRDVDLPPLGMTQINRVSAALGAPSLDTGRISVSTPTPGGLVAAYASVIDNGTNDPRTLLPENGVAPGSPPPGTTSPNLLINPGFDHDLSGWTIDPPETYPNPAFGDVSATWISTDASGLPTSGGLAMRAHVQSHQSARTSLSQCVAVPAGSPLASFGARVLTAGQFGQAGVSVDMTYFASADCSGAPLGSNTSTSPGLSGYPVQTSNGAWLSVAMMAVSPLPTRSARVRVNVSAVGNDFYHSGSVDAIADDVYATVSPAMLVSTILPSAARVHGAQGSLWTTVASLVNPGDADASVTLKWLGHDADGRNGAEFPYLVRAGETLPGVNGGFNDPFAGTFGAILVTSSSPFVFLQSETFSWIQGVGSAGQALPAFGPPDYANTTPKTLAPIRENAYFRTNLVLSNPTDAPLTAHVALFAADGTPLGTRDVDLPPLGMAQINRVASALGATSLDAGRISVSTPTPGGLVAAYASVIDNTTNDPRTLLPR